jgi:hypothetical protein
MRTTLVIALVFACNEAEQPSASGDAAAGEAAEAPSKKADIKDLEADFSEIVQTKRAGDNGKRRDQCLALEPKVAERVEKHPADVKLQQFASQLGSFCPEAIESRKLMKKAAEPEPSMPELSATMKSMFTADTLKSDVKKAKQIAKKKGDPEDTCKKIELTARVVSEKKKKDKKTKKLLKDAVGFCEGPARVATVQFHLREAAKAEKGDQANTLSEHCTAAISKLMHVKAEKQRARLEEAMKSLCREAYALKPMLESRGS